MPEAGEVFLVWRVADATIGSEDIRPLNKAIVKEGVFYKPMERQSQFFVAQLQAPSATPLIFGFWITKNHEGADIEPVWDGGPDYQTVLAESRLLEFDSRVTLGPDHPPQSATTPLLLPQEIHYHTPEAGEVFLIWGVDGWQALSEDLWPAGTLLKGELMRTPMTNMGGVFTTTVRVPSGATLNYGFLITKVRNGANIKPAWEGADEFQKVVKEAGLIVVETKLILAQDQASKAEEPPLVTREIRYYAPEATEVFLVWGINGWHPLVREIWPARTEIPKSKGVMHTLMVQQDKTFVTKIQLPSGSTLDYGFYITKWRHSSDREPVWDSQNAYPVTSTQDGVIELETAAKLAQSQEQAPEAADNTARQLPPSPEKTDVAQPQPSAATATQTNTNNPVTQNGVVQIANPATPAAQTYINNTIFEQFHYSFILFVGAGLILSVITIRFFIRKKHGRLNNIEPIREGDQIGLEENV
jgi:hypothetical protein